MEHHSSWSLTMVMTVDENIHTIKRNTEAVLGASKEAGLEVNAEKTKYILYFLLPECKTKS
jgi:hypothetical protein